MNDTTPKPLALELADALERPGPATMARVAAAAELRRQHQAIVEFREFADEADATLQMVLRTFGDRTSPPKMLDAFAAIVMCKKLVEQYATLTKRQEQ